MEMINAYRSSRPPDGRHRPAGVPAASHHDLDVQSHGLTLWDLDREFADRHLRRRPGP